MRDSVKERSADVNGVWQDLRGVKALGDDARSGVQVIARAARILRSAEGECQGLSLSETAGRVGLARSTVHRIVTALEAERFVVYAANRVRVRLGPGLASLAASARRELRVELHPYLQKLSSQVQETVDLAVLDGDRVYFIDQIPPPHRPAPAPAPPSGGAVGGPPLPRPPPPQRHGPPRHASRRSGPPDPAQAPRAADPQHDHPPR